MDLVNKYNNNLIIQDEIKVKDFYYYIYINDDEDDDPDFLLCYIYINTKQHWEEHQCLKDGFTDEESEILDPILAPLEEQQLIEEASAATFSCFITKEEIESLLKTAGLTFNKDFADWMERDD